MDNSLCGYNFTQAEQEFGTLNKQCAVAPLGSEIVSDDTYNLTIKPDDIAKYLQSINITGDWVSSRDPNFPVNSASKFENRYNHDGDVAYYLASGKKTMTTEVPNWEERDIYRVEPTTIDAFDLASWSKDAGCHEEFLKSKASGGYGLCQYATDQLTGVYGLTGILYNSYGMHSVGETGYCLVVLPPSGQLVDGTFFAKDSSHVVKAPATPAPTP